MSKTYGYARTSSKDQCEDRQILALNCFGVDQIFVDQQSGKDFDRPQYKKLLRKLKAGDTIVVKSIDRLGRNYAEILEQWRVITKDKRADIVVLDTPLLDTRQRQAEGIAAAKARGVKFGRQPLPKPNNYDDVVALWKDGKISGRKAAKLLGVSNFTFIRWIRNDSNK